MRYTTDLRAAYAGFHTCQRNERSGAWTESGKPIPCSPRWTLTALTPDERALYEDLTDPAWTRVRRIEQERIPLTEAAMMIAPRTNR